MTQLDVALQLERYATVVRELQMNRSGWRPPETGWQPLCGKCPDCLAWAQAQKQLLANDEGEERP